MWGRLLSLVSWAGDLDMRLRPIAPQGNTGSRNIPPSSQMPHTDVEPALFCVSTPPTCLDVAPL